MTTFKAVLKELGDGQVHTTQDLGEILWPEMIFRHPAQGGPSNHQSSASRLLGRLRRRGYVHQVWENEWPVGWQITDEGRKVIIEE